MLKLEIHQTAKELPPEFQPVIISGGIGMMKHGLWFSGMEYPLYERPLEWKPTWWMKIPDDN